MRSKHVSLILVPLLLTACSRDNTLQQDVYKNQFDCMQDWGVDLCEPETPDGYQYTYSTMFYGPQYYRGTRKVKMIATGKQRKPKSSKSLTAPKISQTLIANAKSRPIRGGFGRGSTSGGG